jgi:4'-phosphopantetheinyl transferase
VLSEEEQAQQQRFVFDRDRKQYLVSHALIRDVLSRYAGIPPEDWRFDINPYGRPSIASPDEWRGLRFNLSHTRGRAILAMARGVEVGVDVEYVSETRNLTNIGERFFSAREIEQLRVAPSLFFDFWTLKEAYIKARGMGLAIPLDSFGFCLTDPRNPQIWFGEMCPDQPENWQFVLRRGDGYRMALAVKAAAGSRVVIVERDAIPLAAHTSADQDFT